MVAGVRNSDDSVAQGAGRPREDVVNKGLLQRIKEVVRRVINWILSFLWYREKKAPPSVAVEPVVPLSQPAHSSNEAANERFKDARDRWRNSNDPEIHLICLNEMFHALQEGANIYEWDIMCDIVNSYNLYDVKDGKEIILINEALKQKPNLGWLNNALDRSIFKFSVNDEPVYFELAEKLIAAGAEVSSLSDAKKTIFEVEKLRRSPNRDNAVIRKLLAESVERLRKKELASEEKAPSSVVVEPAYSPEATRQFQQASIMWRVAGDVAYPRLHLKYLKEMHKALQAGADINDPQIACDIVDSYRLNDLEGGREFCLIDEVLKKKPTVAWLNQALGRSMFDYVQTKKDVYFQLAEKLIGAGAEVSSLSKARQFEFKRAQINHGQQPTSSFTPTTPEEDRHIHDPIYGREPKRSRRPLKPVSKK